MEARRNRLIGYAKAMADCYCRADLKVAVFDGLLASEPRRRIDDSYGGYAYAALCGTLMEDLIRDVWAFTLDRAKKTPSLSNVWSLMESAAFRESQRAWFSAPPDSVWNEDAMSSLSAAQRHAFDVEFDAQTQSRLGRHFDTTIDRLDLAIPSLLGGPLASKLDAARKRGIAHYEMNARPGRRPARFDWAQLGIDWERLKSFIEQVRTPLFDVTFVVTRGTYALESLAATNRLYAEDFWSRLQGIGPVNEPPEAVWAEMARVEGLRLQGIIYGV